MREIKFRAWDFTENKMMDTSELSYGVQYNKNKIEIISQKDCFTFMQYTGLKDKNGVDIYEGDVVKDLRSPFKDIRSYSKVFYQEDRGRFVFGGWEIPAGLSHTFEVIGNIYENPELMEEGN